MDQKKAHHFIPVCYLINFMDSKGKLTAYRKDDPTNPFRVLPKNIAVTNKYYSQPLPGGGWDHNSIEDFFDEKIEREWRPIVERIKQREEINQSLVSLFTFIISLRVRVPAARDMVESCLAEFVRIELQHLEATKQLPPAPVGIEHLLEQIEVAIDPHKSIHAMHDLAKGVATILDALGFEILHNKTRLPIITSDNPVIYFDPSKNDKEIQPYSVSPDGKSAELFFPIDPWNVLHGHTDLKESFATRGITYKNAYCNSSISRINRLLTRFAYQIVFANSDKNAPVIKKYAHHSPVFEAKAIPCGAGEYHNFRSVFGPRMHKPKWKHEPRAQ